MVTIRIGNTHEHLGSTVANGYPHQWTCFVDVVDVTCRRRGSHIPVEALVNAIVFDLHPTFDPSRISISAAQSILQEGGTARAAGIGAGGLATGGGGCARRFAIQRFGWGTFVVRITVIFCGSYRIFYKHR